MTKSHGIVKNRHKIVNLSDKKSQTCEKKTQKVNKNHKLV